MSPENIESFVNDYLRKDLKELEHHLQLRNAEVMEFIQLKNTVETIKENLDEGFKTQVNIGANIFMEAEAKNSKQIYVNIGKDIFLDFSLEEAIAFSNCKIRILNKELDVIRDESIKKRADIKLALMCLGDQQKLNEDFNNK